MTKSSLLIICLITFCGAGLVQADSGSSYCNIDRVSSDLAALSPVIGAYPPKIATSAEREKVLGEYSKIEKTLEAMSKKCPNILEVTLGRAKLKSMGHNIDLKDAWQQAEKDFQEVLRQAPRKIQALLGLGFLYVNSDIRLASKAESLFKRAQEAAGSEILIAAHRGLIFAYYYQVKLKDAQAEVELVLQSSPNNKVLTELKSIIEAKINESRKNSVQKQK